MEDADEGGLAPPSSSLLRISTQAGPQGIASSISNALLFSVLFSAGRTTQPLTQDEKKETGRGGGEEEKKKKKL